MPICLNTGWVVCPNRVFQSELLRKLDANFLHSSFKFVTAANLVVVAGFEKVDKTLRWQRWSIGLLGFGKQCDEVREFVVLAHPLRQRGDKAGLVPEVIGESLVAGEILSIARIYANVDFSRDAPKMADGLGVFPK